MNRVGRLAVITLLLGLFALPVSASSGAALGGEGNLEALKLITILIIQLSLILLAAKVGGEICERYLRQPGVLGELIVGMIIGPYALGSLIRIPLLAGPLFPLPEINSPVPVSRELFAFAQIAAVVLLFMAGLETDVRRFIRYGMTAAIIALGGVIVPFFLGVSITILFGLATSIRDPLALFMGAIMTATSVGITARVLGDIGKLDTPEGVTILAGAVVDDILAILALAIAVSLAGEKAGIAYTEITLVTLRAIGIWVGLVAAGLLLSRQIEKILGWFKTEGSVLALSLSLCFFAAAIAELFGLTMIIGAYAMGLALSNTEISSRLEDALKPVYHFVVPIFFVVMGMMVNFRAMGTAVTFGLVFSLLAVFSKVFGCALPALGVGFNRVGAFRIGIGMLPRGEVALIIASIGLASKVIQSDMFGVAIMMTLATTILAPIILVPAFNLGGPGCRREL
ncbi:MAG: cation:proton antiporter [Deltaproteobacteria bacterium]|nr:MAG: cation:proton antiporter [Deltaproteobacteria bacterium]